MVKFLVIFFSAIGVVGWSIIFYVIFFVEPPKIPYQRFSDRLEDIRKYML